MSLLNLLSSNWIKYKSISKCIFYTASVVLLVSVPANGAVVYDGIVGKNEWLFYRQEFLDAKSREPTSVSLDLIQRFNKVLSTHNISMAVVMVPLKMRIYSEHLPDSVKLNEYMAGNYDRMIKALEAGGANVIDLNTSFMSTSKRTDVSPLYFRLDSHWSPTGSMLAAEVIKAGILANPALKKAVDETPNEEYKVVYGRRKRSTGRDLIGLLPPNSLTFAPEQVAQMSVSRSQPLNFDLLGNRAPIGLTLLGSSYSKDWTGFADGLRYELQRDILSIGVGADQGSWVGLESYLRDDAFQTKAPKLLLWEIPERDMHAPPSYEFRDPRYRIDDTEWLLRVSAWVQPTCTHSTVTVKLALVGLAAQAPNLKGSNLATGPTTDTDFVELVFDKPFARLDYLSIRATTAGSKTLTLEASGSGVTTRRFTVNVAGDDLAHALKMPLPSGGSGFTKVKIFPGSATAFALQNLQVCRQPEGLLPS